jgi:hypothetical protein
MVIRRNRLRRPILHRQHMNALAGFRACRGCQRRRPCSLQKIPAIPNLHNSPAAEFSAAFNHTRAGSCQRLYFIRSGNML